MLDIGCGEVTRRLKEMSIRGGKESRPTTLLLPQHINRPPFEADLEKGHSDFGTDLVTDLQLTTQRQRRSAHGEKQEERSSLDLLREPLQALNAPLLQKNTTTTPNDLLLAIAKWQIQAFALPHFLFYSSDYFIQPLTNWFSDEFVFPSVLENNDVWISTTGPYWLAFGSCVLLSFYIVLEFYYVWANRRLYEYHEQLANLTVKKFLPGFLAFESFELDLMQNCGAVVFTLFGVMADCSGGHYNPDGSDNGGPPLGAFVSAVFGAMLVVMNNFLMVLFWATGVRTQFSHCDTHDPTGTTERRKVIDHCTLWSKSLRKKLCAISDSLQCLSGRKPDPEFEPGQYANADSDAARAISDETAIEKAGEHGKETTGNETDWLSFSYLEENAKKHLQELKKIVDKFNEEELNETLTASPSTNVNDSDSESKSDEDEFMKQLKKTRDLVMQQIRRGWRLKTWCEASVSFLQVVQYALMKWIYHAVRGMSFGGSESSSSIIFGRPTVLLPLFERVFQYTLPLFIPCFLYLIVNRIEKAANRATHAAHAQLGKIIKTVPEWQDFNNLWILSLTDFLGPFLSVFLGSSDPGSLQLTLLQGAVFGFTSWIVWTYQGWAWSVDRRFPIWSSSRWENSGGQESGLGADSVRPGRSKKWFENFPATKRALKAQMEGHNAAFH